jgi:hypothetical protein
MASRLRITGVVLLIVGIVALGAAGYAYMKVQGGASALQGFSDAQQVRLSYNDEGRLVDRGETEGADAILALLRDDWNWPVVDSELNPNDPVTNTATEYMYQMATIAHHTLSGTQTVVLTEPVYWDGDSVEAMPVPVPEGTTTYAPGEWDPSTVAEAAIFQPGVYEVPVANRYYTQFNRSHPLDGPTREQAWNGLVHGLFAELGVGATTASSLELGQGVALVTALMGVSFLILGGLLVWVGLAKEPEPATQPAKAAVAAA